MNLRTKTMCILAGAISIAIILLVTTGRSFWLNRYADLEEYYVCLTMERVDSTINNEIEDLIYQCRNYSGWDDTYEYVLDQNPDYYESNIVPSTFVEGNFDFMLAVNLDDKLVIAEQYDRENERLTKPSPSITDLAASDNKLLNIQKEESHIEGIIVLPEGPALIASQPILNSDYEGPVHGTMLVGRYFDSAYIDKLSELIQYEVDIIPFYGQDSGVFPRILARQPQNFNQTTLVAPRNENETIGYKVLNDIDGKPAAVVKMTIPRGIYHEGTYSFWYFVAFWVACALFFFFLIIKLLSTAVLNKIENLNQEVTNISHDGDLKKRVNVTGRDEVTSLAQAINSMLGIIEDSHNQVLNQEKEYRRLFNDSITANFVCDQGGRIVLCNPAFVAMFNFGSTAAANLVPISTLFRSNLDYQECRKRMEQIGSEQDFEMAMQTYDGRPIMVKGNLFADMDAEGRIQRITGYLSDITERKSAEEKLRYLGEHDPNTGLYNRSYYEKCVNEAEEQHLHPLSIIIGDIDGLKLVNDTLGTDAGDALLKTAGRIISASVEEPCVVARMGGDEFAVLLYPERAYENVVIVEKIRKMVDEYNKANPDLPLSLSLGTSRVGSSSGAKAADLYREATNYMNREKLYRARSGRSSLVAALTSTMEARDYITEGHAERLQILIEKLARSMNMGEHRITDLKLFAQFHDIGKVGVPDHILNKPGILNPEEWEEMQRHSEIGYRIAQAAPELHHIADWILKHHEWWNGQGYPLGISGLDIPLESRMLAIVDAYDAMTNDRPYRSEMVSVEALQILTMQSGIQFDPDLVSRFLLIMEGEISEAAAADDN